MTTELTRFGGARLPRPVRNAILAEGHAGMLAAARISAIATATTFAHHRVAGVVATQLAIQQQVPHSDAYLSALTLTAVQGASQALARLAFD